MERDYNLEKRKYVIGASVIVIVLIYLIRLFTLQIMSEDYKKNADSNAFLNKTQYPSRGVMYDRNGNLLVYNQPAYDVTMVMKEVHNLDTLEVRVEMNENLFADEIRKLQMLEGRLQKTIKEYLGVSAKVRLMEPRSIERSEGKAKRIVDNRKD